MGKLVMCRIYEVPWMGVEETCEFITRFLMENGDGMLGKIPTPSEVKNNPERYYLLIDEERKEVLGVGAIYLRKGKLMKIAISKKHRGKGLGRYLVGMLIDIGIENEVTSFYAEVREDNVPMRNLLKSIGFVEDGEFITEDGRRLIVYRLYYHKVR